MHDELDAIANNHSDLQEPTAVIGADQHREIVEGEDSDRVSIGVKHVVIADPVFACTFEHNGIHVINLP